MSIDGPGREQLRDLTERLKDAGDAGKGLRRKLADQMDKAARPLAAKIGDAERLKPYMPDRYADALAADLTVSVQRVFAGSSPRVSIIAKGREHKRKVQRVEDGLLMHPVFAQGPRRRPRFVTAEVAKKYGLPVHAIRGWTWLKEPQTAGMRPGWFSDPCEAAVPDIRDHVLDAIEETAAEITSGL